MVRTRDRIIIIIITVAFFATSFAVSFFVILEIVRDNKEAKQMDQSSSSATSDPTQPTKGTAMPDFTPISKVNELQKIDLQVGTGKEVKPGDSVTVDYTGALAATGVVFQSSVDFGQPISFSLSGVIKGWQDGIPGMKEGGKRRLIIPASLAYGSQVKDDIPANSDLVFDVTLRSVGE